MFLNLCLFFEFTPRVHSPKDVIGSPGIRSEARRNLDTSQNIDPFLGIWTAQAVTACKRCDGVVWRAGIMHPG